MGFVGHQVGSCRRSDHDFHVSTTRGSSTYSSTKNLHTSSSMRMARSRTPHASDVYPPPSRIRALRSSSESFADNSHECSSTAVAQDLGGCMSRRSCRDSAYGRRYTKSKSSHTLTKRYEMGDPNKIYWNFRRRGAYQNEVVTNMFNSGTSNYKDGYKNYSSYNSQKSGRRRHRNQKDFPFSSTRHSPSSPKLWYLHLRRRRFQSSPTRNRQHCSDWDTRRLPHRRSPSNGEHHRMDTRYTVRRRMHAAGDKSPCWRRNNRRQIVHRRYNAERDEDDSSIYTYRHTRQKSRRTKMFNGAHDNRMRNSVMHSNRQHSPRPVYNHNHQHNNLRQQGFNRASRGFRSRCFQNDQGPYFAVDGWLPSDEYIKTSATRGRGVCRRSYGAGTNAVNKRHPNKHGKQGGSLSYGRGGGHGGDRPKDECSNDERDTIRHFDWYPGMLLKAHLKVVGQLGDGTFGRVLKCYDSSRSASVAVKVVRDVERYTEAAKIEAHILSDLHKADVNGDSGCVRVYECFMYSHTNLCIVTEPLGLSLLEFLTDNRYRGFLMRHIRDIARQCLRTLDFLRKLKLTHTDLKPENILLSDDAYDWAVNPRAYLPMTDYGDSSYSSSLASSTPERPQFYVEEGRQMYWHPPHQQAVLDRNTHGRSKLVAGARSSNFTYGSVSGEPHCDTQKRSTRGAQHSSCEDTKPLTTQQQEGRPYYHHPHTRGQEYRSATLTPNERRNRSVWDSDSCKQNSTAVGDSSTQSENDEDTAVTASYGYYRNKRTPPAVLVRDNAELRSSYDQEMHLSDIGKTIQSPGTLGRAQSVGCSEKRREQHQSEGRKVVEGNSEVVHNGNIDFVGISDRSGGGGGGSSRGLCDSRDAYAARLMGGQSRSGNEKCCPHNNLEEETQEAKRNEDDNRDDIYNNNSVVGGSLTSMDVHLSEDAEVVKASSKRMWRSGYMKVPRRVEVKLIDFGSAAYEDEKRSALINTRQYRAPEVILDVGWSMESDLWSLGCILIELYTGSLLFKTHEHLEHLAMVEKIVQPIPSTMLRAATKGAGRKYVHNRELHLNWPEGASGGSSLRRVNSCQPLESLVAPHHRLFVDFLKSLLQVDPSKRPLPHIALTHRFFDEDIPE
eukprot:Lankesteria_metandrocarpae@DN4448_c0_g1_i1.p1